MSYPVRGNYFCKQAQCCSIGLQSGRSHQRIRSMPVTKEHGKGWIADPICDRARFVSSRYTQGDRLPGESEVAVLHKADVSRQG